MSGYIIFSPEKRKEIFDAHKEELEGACDCAYNFEVGCEPHNCRVIDIVYAIASGKLVAYQNNRGDGRVNDDLAKMVANEPNPHCLAQFVVGYYRSLMTVADGNSRIEGLMQRFSSGKLTEEEKNYVISVRCVPTKEFLKTYEICNTAKPHSAREKIINPDFLYGRFFKELNEMSGGLWEELRTGKRSIQMTYIMEWFACKKSTVKYVDIFACRTKSKVHHLTAASPREIKSYNLPMERIIAGLQFYKEVIDCLDYEIKSGRVRDVKPYKTLIASGPLFAIIVSDVANNEYEFGKSSARLAARLMSKTSELLGLLPLITSSTYERMWETELHIRAKMSPKQH